MLLLVMVRICVRIPYVGGVCSYYTSLINLISLIFFSGYSFLSVSLRYDLITGQFYYFLLYRKSLTTLLDLQEEINKNATLFPISFVKMGMEKNYKQEEEIAPSAMSTHRIPAYLSQFSS